MRNTTIPLMTLVFAMIGLLQTQPVLAKFYKWVDENGVTQYTATPPPKGDFKTVKPPPKPAVEPAKAQSEFQKRVDAFKKRREATEKAKKEADEQAAKDAEAKKNCEQAKKNLNLLQTKVRVRYTEKDGSVHYLTDEERAAKLQRANDAIKSYCK